MKNIPNAKKQTKLEEKDATCNPRPGVESVISATKWNRRRTWKQLSRDISESGKSDKK